MGWQLFPPQDGDPAYRSWTFAWTGLGSSQSKAASNMLANEPTFIFGNCSCLIAILQHNRSVMGNVVRYGCSRISTMHLAEVTGTRFELYADVFGGTSLFPVVASMIFESPANSVDEEYLSHWSAKASIGTCYSPEGLSSSSEHENRNRENAYTLSQYLLSMSLHQHDFHKCLPALPSTNLILVTDINCLLPQPKPRTRLQPLGVLSSMALSSSSNFRPRLQQNSTSTTSTIAPTTTTPQEKN
ncbi:hypothetical protein CERZMDRAFT_83149 [Cercospora zeae-maydis SCOH1-5]|uniref:Uncharacterized protein n=1 Tax=Cercospora zeae-maydis SCOH1-5 TaxID=717836 RepID=A0A6A6FMD1_9PEZI|nr:hypothetical protein CERZMDRAFT_83149 [Cercospora zeae-maydis SCOH1-5]